MRETANLFRTSRRQILVALLAIMVCTMVGAEGDACAAGILQTRGASQPRNAQPRNAQPRNAQAPNTSNPTTRGSALPPRRGSNLQAAPLPGRTGAPTTSQASSTRSNSTAPAASFPYSVTTINPRTAIRSIPSDEGYATAYVGPQTELQVWRHDPNGWLAIRPPDGSFSLVDAKHLKATNDPDVFLVATDRAQTWVGTQIDEDHIPISQVRLKLNERVAVISSLIIEEEAGAQTWYQIEPPAGEFRWVHQDDLRSGGRVVPAPSATEIANRPNPPANAPMSGYMPPLSNTSAASPGPNGFDLPPLEIEPGYGRSNNSSTVQPSDVSQWRAAQQTSPVLGYVEPQPWSDTHPVSHATTPGSNFADGSFVQPVASQFQPSASRPLSPGETWDAAVNQLRQDPVANAVANASHQAVDQQPASQPAITSSNQPSATQPDPQWATMDWNQKLAWVQTRLSQESSLPTTQWNLMPLLEHCRTLWYAAPSTGQQEAAATLGKRIEELLLWQYSRGSANDLSAQASMSASPNDPWAGQRWASAGSMVGSGVPATTSNSTPFLNGSSPFNLGPGVTPENAFPSGTPTGPATAPPANTAFDAVGYLKELVIARGQRSNEYVLQDNNGISICHISAQPGVNLNTFLDQKVGVIGIKGINGKLNLPHVSVERIYRVQ